MKLYKKILLIALAMSSAAQMNGVKEFAKLKPMQKPSFPSLFQGLKSKPTNVIKTETTVGVQSGMFSWYRSGLALGGLSLLTYNDPQKLDTCNEKKV